ncbi:MAG: 30S ribosomal protein S6 [Candidatus Omnitrophota bacterium]|nr:30S ribosomal protein S6 [Candidatus Omnitrophota bacterium]
MLKDYEGMFIVKPDLSQTESQDVIKGIEEVITSNKGVIKDNLAWGKRQLTYKMGKYKEGLYQLIHFQTDSSSIMTLKRAYGLNENILRILITDML